MSVNLAVAALLVLALGLTWFTLWFWLRTRPESEVLGRLEVMSSRHWRQADYTEKQTSLEEVRPFGGGDGPQADGFDDAPVTGQHELIRPEDGEPLVGRSLAELVELVDAADAIAGPPTGEPIGDPAVLKALGLDDESLGIGPASLVGLADTVDAAAPDDLPDGPVTEAVPVTVASDEPWELDDGDSEAQRKSPPPEPLD